MIHLPDPGEEPAKASVPFPKGSQPMTVFQLPIEPSRTTASSGYRIMRKKDGTQFIGRYKKGDSKKYQDRMTVLLRSELRAKVANGDYVVPAPTQPLKVLIAFTFPQVSGSKSLQKTGCLKTTRPDLDNMAKSVLDACVDAGLFHDDNQISCLELWKFHAAEGEAPHINICVGRMKLTPGP